MNTFNQKQQLMREVWFLLSEIGGGVPYVTVNLQINVKDIYIDEILVKGFYIGDVVLTYPYNPLLNKKVPTIDLRVVVKGETKMFNILSCNSHTITAVRDVLVEVKGKLS